ncbi:MAG: cyclic nucleotide-binding domain-containing protein [Pseudomonadales bacterium]|nr:cyclic nucleotide-binding domain-containing protein [Pseudomonadales bacterium]
MKRLDPVDPAKALGILNKVLFFDEFSQAEKEILTGFHSHFFVAAEGEVIIRESNDDLSSYILLTGSVQVRKSGADKPLARLGPGSLFGEISFLTERKRTTSVIAETTVILFELDRPTLKYLNPPIREKLKDNIIRVLVTRLDEMNQRLISLQGSGYS